MVALQSGGPVRDAAAAGAPLASTLVARKSGPGDPPKPRLLDRVREAIRTRHYSRRTEKTYVAWIRRYILFHGKRHPAEMGPAEITQFLTSLAVKGELATPTQNQALSALLFLYREVLKQELPWIDGVVRARRPERLPVVLTRDEVRAVLEQLVGAPRRRWRALCSANRRRSPLPKRHTRRCFSRMSRGIGLQPSECLFLTIVRCSESLRRRIRVCGTS